MIWKDRIKQYPHRYTLTNVSGSTYDFAEVTGDVNEAGTPVNAENLNKLIQRDGDDIKDTVTTFTEASTRANIATGESTATVFGKIKKWLTDLKAHAFKDLATAQGAEADIAPSNKLLTESSLARVYRMLEEISPSFTISTVTPLEILNGMSDSSMAILDVNVTNPHMPGTYGQFKAYKRGGLRADCEFTQKILNSKVSHRWIAEVRPQDSTNQFSGWKQIFTTDNISTVMPISSAAASNDKVLGEKVVYDEFALKAYNRKYNSFSEISGSITTNSTFTDIIGYMSTLSILYIDISLYSYTNLITGLGSIKYGTLTIYKDENSNAELTLSCKQANTTAYTFYKSQYRNSDSSNNWSGWQQIATTDNPTFTGSPSAPTPTTAQGIANKEYVDSLIPYDKVIRTQAEFEALIASPTWLDAVSVALVGQFTLSTANNSGIKIPQTVKQIHGFNGAKITVTNFLSNLSTAKGGLWYDTAPTTEDYSIRDLEVDCTATGTNGRGFHNCTNLTNCTGTATGTGFAGYGFWSCTNLTNCTGTGTGITGYGFYNITTASNCSDGGSSSNMWGGENKNINLETCRKTLSTADNTTLNT